MHELSIAVSLIEQITDVAQENDLLNVVEVEVESGILRQLVSEVMQEAYQSVIEGTIAENSILTLTEVAALAECLKCKEHFEPSVDNFLCPQCYVADVKILQGDEIILKSVIGDSNKKEEQNES